MHQNQSHDCDNLILDGNNLCYINFFANKEASEEDFLGLTFMYTLSLIKNISKRFSPKNIVIAFDSHSWRKEFTKRKDVCLTHKVYKAHRKANLEPKIKKKLEILEKEINDFAGTLRTCSSMLVLKRNLLEGDDLIAGYVHRHSMEKNIIVSSDKDFMQLISSTTSLYNPVSDEFRNLDEYDNDSAYFLFEKCIRGDAGDNVISSYPRLRKTKIQKAFKDDFEKTNIMNNVFEVEDLSTGTLVKYKYKTADLFEENKFLMSLYDQPEEIKELIDQTIEASAQTRSRFALFDFLKFCAKYNMVNTIKFIEQYKSILSLKSLGE
jgi:5'-3' exonuclease